MPANSRADKRKHKLESPARKTEHVAGQRHGGTFKNANLMR